MDFGDEEGWGRPGFIPGVIALAVMLAMSAFTFYRLPSGTEIPMQIGAGGNLQNYMPKGYALLLEPGLLMVLGLFMNAVPFVPTGNKEVPLLLWYAMIAVLFGCHVFTVVMAFRHSVSSAGL